ncbi:MAG: phage portal protein [Eubacteriales bacterium]
MSDYIENTAASGLPIELWKSWWQGFDRGFHRFYENSAGVGIVKREMYRMNMAKKICEDWASLLFNDSCTVRISDDAGEKFVKRIFSENDFWGAANLLTEKAFALGTAAAIMRLSGFECGEDGIYATDKSKITFEYVDAAHIHPISVKNGRIVEAAFISEEVIRGETYIYVETHRLENGEYVITNELYAPEDGEYVSKGAAFGGDVPEVIRTGSPYPFFAILTPNIQNNFDPDSGMGVSVFADAIDCLKGVDLAFNNFCRDIKLGGKKVFLSQSLIQRDGYGNVITPDDVAQQLFVTLGDGDISEHPMINEHNPELRTEENALAVQWQLNYLAFRCGLGTHHYTFDIDGRTKLTATQYMGERQDMRQNLVKHQRNAKSFIVSLVRALLWCAREYYGLEVDPAAEIVMSFDDSYFADSDSEREADLREVEAGVMTADEFRQKWKGGVTNG